MSITKKAFLFVVAILVVDQIIKILVKTNMSLDQEIMLIGDSVRLHFTENNGMAFGQEFGGLIGKIFLSLFRIVAVSAIAWYIVRIAHKGAPKGVIFGLAAVCAGALGNIFDSLFYGIIFGKSTFFSVAQFLPEGGGYASFLTGKVVDMFYCPIIDFYLPKWSPIWAGERFIFFRPIFNFADAAITCGVAYLIIFQRKFFKDNGL